MHQRQSISIFRQNRLVEMQFINRGGEIVLELTFNVLSRFPHHFAYIVLKENLYFDIKHCIIDLMNQILP